MRLKKKTSKKSRLRPMLSRRKQAFKEALPNGTPALGENVPRITNETVAAHREEVIGKARKYKYPLQHSKHKIVVISGILFVTGVVAFFGYCTLALYKLQSTSTFMYRVTQVIPFPVARADDRFVSYESYLFELRHYTHYYDNHAKQDFTAQQLQAFKKQALDKVVNDAYIKHLAEQNNVSVTDREVTDQIAIVRNQNRLGSSDKVLEDVLKDYWGWSLEDFKRSLRQELLARKVASALDTAAHGKAEAALAELRNGADFAAVAKKYSEDPSKDSGGDYGAVIAASNRDVPPAIHDAMFKLQAGQFSDIVNTGYSLEILKCIETTTDKVHAAHIVIKLKDIMSYVNDVKDKHKARTYIKN